MTTTEPATTPHILPSKMIPYETAKKAVSWTCHSEMIHDWFESFAGLLLCANHTTWDPINTNDVIGVLQGLAYGARYKMEECEREALEMLERA